jgi:hypothetical protein
MSRLKHYLHFGLILAVVVTSAPLSAEGGIDCQCTIDDGVFRSSAYNNPAALTPIVYRRHGGYNRRRRYEPAQHLLSNKLCQKFFETDENGDYILDGRNQPTLGVYGKAVYNLVLGHARSNPEILSEPRDGEANAGLVPPRHRGLPLCANYANLQTYDERILAYTVVITALIATEAGCDPTVVNPRGAVGFGQVESQRKLQIGNHRYPDCIGSKESLKNPIKNLKCIVGELLVNNMPLNGEHPYDLTTDEGIATNNQWQVLHRGQPENSNFLTLVRDFPLCKVDPYATETAQAPASTRRQF